MIKASKKLPVPKAGILGFHLDLGSGVGGGACSEVKNLPAIEAQVQSPRGADP